MHGQIIPVNVYKELLYIQEHVVESNKMHEKNVPVLTVEQNNILQFNISFVAKCLRRFTVTYETIRIHLI